MGSYQCTCNTGYDGNGTSCTGTLQCLSIYCIVANFRSEKFGGFTIFLNIMETIFADAVNATLNSAQYNNNTLFHCSIPDINECKTGATECHENAECSNTDVGFLCVCSRIHWQWNPLRWYAFTWSEVLSILPLLLCTLCFP